MLRLIVFAFLALTVMAAAAGAATIRTDHISADVVVRNAVTRPGDVTGIAIAHKLAPGWHTYWINPGDSGEPPILEFGTEGGGSVGEIRFPTPSRLPYPPLLNFGYKNRFTLLTEIRVPEDWPDGRDYRVPLRIDWLVCEEICIPEGGETEIVIPTGPVSAPDSGVAFTFVSAERSMPTVSDAEATYSREEDTIYLTVPVGTAEDAVFFPLQRGVIDNVAAQEAIPAADGDGMTLVLAGGNANLDGTMPGVLKTAGGAYAITATGDPDAPLAAAAAPAPSAAGPAAPSVPPSVPPLGALGAAPVGLAQALVFAFLGGLILNLMPCVFPVLALKALGLVAHADASFGRRATIGAAYTSGILTSFAVLAGVLLALKAAGVAVGWGFQLQSPAFVALLAGLMFVVALNLSGVFQIGVGLTRLGGRGPSDGVAGSFATGCLATLVATPCTAPFMAAAIGTALAAAPTTALLVFLAMGLGLAAPFVLLSLVPSLARVLPRPGVWMVRLKEVLAFPLYATAAWLVWVLAQLVGLDAMLGVLIALVLVALAAWLFGLSQRGSGGSHRIAAGLSLASLLGALYLAWPSVSDGAAAARGPALAANSGAFTPARLQSLRAEGRPVFVNVTAAWCITCKVNERVVFETDAFHDLLADNGVTFLTADWTRRDVDVTALMDGFGRAGVPLYLYFPASGEPEILPQILTLSALQSAFAAPERS